MRVSHLHLGFPPVTSIQHFQILQHVDTNFVCARYIGFPEISCFRNYEVGCVQRRGVGLASWNQRTFFTLSCIPSFIWTLKCTVA